MKISLQLRNKSMTRASGHFLSYSMIPFILVLCGYAPLTYANSCRVTPPATGVIPLGGTGTFHVDCDTNTCAVVVTSLPPNEIPVSPPTADVGTISIPFFLTNNLTGPSGSIIVNWTCPSSTGDIEGSFSISTPPSPSAGTAADNFFSGNTNDPINTYTGEFYNQYPPDISLGGPFPLTFSRYYASGLEISSALVGRWRHNYEWSGNFTSASKKIITTPWGRTITFVKTDATWSLSGKTDIAFQLHQAVQFGPYTLFDPRDQLVYEFKFSGDPRLISIRDGKGNVQTLNYVDSFSKTIASVSDGLGRVLNFTYINFGLDLISVDDGMGRSVNFGYIANPTGFGSLLDSVIDVRGNTTTYSYTGDNLMTSSVRPQGNTPFSQTWDTNDQVASQTDSNGNTTTLTYTGVDTTITDALLQNRKHTHTATGELANSQDAAGLNVAIGSDAKGRRNSITDRLNDVTTMSYHDSSGQLASLTHADETSTSFSYTARATTGGNTAHDLTGTTHADGTTQSFVYDTVGNLTSRTDQLGNSSTTTYNGFGQILTSTNKLGGVSSNIYNDGVASANTDQTLLTRTDVVGNTTTSAYDGLRRLNQITRPDTSTIGFTYDDADNLLTSTDENSNTATFIYDDNGNRVSAQRPLDTPTSRTKFAYDGNDRLLSITNPLGGVVSKSYDELGRIGTTTDANSNLTSYGYDVHNRLTLITDPLLNAWSRSYDLEGVIASSANSLGNTTQFLSDKMGRITQTSSPLEFINKVSYDAMGRVATTTDALNKVTTFNRDARGQLSGIDLPGGSISASYTRNALGQITVLTDPNNNSWGRSYDSSARLTARTDPFIQSTTTTYDNRNRPDIITFPDTLGTQTQTYDPASNLTQIAYRDNTNTLTLTRGFSFDANDRLTAANSGAGNDVTRSYDVVGRINDSNGIGISRDAGGRITGMTLAPTKIITYVYDANDRLTSVSDWAGGTTTFSYDNANRLIGIIRPNGISTTHSWDNDSRLIGISETTATTTVSSIALTRDGRGQITAANRNVPLSASGSTLADYSHSFDAASQVSTYSYDALGRRTASNGNSFSWDAASRLISSTIGGNTATYSYDAFGRRTTRTASGINREVVWNDAFPLANISIEKQGNVDQQYFIHTPGGALLYSMDATNNARSFHHFDEMGNTILVTNDVGATVGTYAYSPFGERISASGNVDTPFTWQGQFGIMTEGDGLYYIRARYYDANAGRFLSRDPIRSSKPMTINPYQYALNNTLRFVDLNGRGVELAPFGRFGLQTDKGFLAATDLENLPFRVAGTDNGIDIEELANSPTKIIAAIFTLEDYLANKIPGVIRVAEYETAFTAKYEIELAAKYEAEFETDEAETNGRLFAVGFPSAFSIVAEFKSSNPLVKSTNPLDVDFGPAALQIEPTTVDYFTALALTEAVQALQQFNFTFGIRHLQEVLFFDLLSNREAVIKPSNTDKIKSVIPELQECTVLC